MSGCAIGIEEGIVASQSRYIIRIILLVLFMSTVGTIFDRVSAQDSGVQQKIAEIKQASAQNKQELATYTWQEQDTISLKGEVKKQESYQVHMGPDGKPQKTPLNATPAAAPPAQAESGRRGGRVKEHVIENKKEEYKEYAQKIAALAHSYAPPDPAKLQQAQQQGNVKIAPGSADNQVQLQITNYLKPNDSMTITFDKAAKAIQRVQIASYMDSPQDAVKIAVQFTKLPEGVNHIAAMTVEGVSKQLKVAVQNSDYKKM
jgi:23S rRNA pseudoU1915 N3-methylase RlmH